MMVNYGCSLAKEMVGWWLLRPSVSWTLIQTGWLRYVSMVCMRNRAFSECWYLSGIHWTALTVQWSGPDDRVVSGTPSYNWALMWLSNPPHRFPRGLLHSSKEIMQPSLFHKIAHFKIHVPVIQNREYVIYTYTIRTHDHNVWSSCVVDGHGYDLSEDRTVIHNPDPSSNQSCERTMQKILMHYACTHNAWVMFQALICFKAIENSVHGPIPLPTPDEYCRIDLKGAYYLKLGRSGRLLFKQIMYSEWVTRFRLLSLLRLIL